MGSIRIYTIGHSIRSEQEFLNLLKQNHIEMLVDVRTIPRSRRNPQFNANHLETALHNAGLQYVHMAELGGLRKPQRNSKNTGWKNPGFRGYADHMLSDSFQQGINRLIQYGSKQTVALMCAEAFYRKCHRMLLSDALTVRNVEVWHIVSENEILPHILTSFARVDDIKITYPEEQTGLDF